MWLLVYKTLHKYVPWTEKGLLQVRLQSISYYAPLIRMTRCCKMHSRAETACMIQSYCNPPEASKHGKREVSAYDDFTPWGTVPGTQSAPFHCTDVNISIKNLNSAGEHVWVTLKSSKAMTVASGQIVCKLDRALAWPVHGLTHNKHLCGLPGAEL